MAVDSGNRKTYTFRSVGESLEEYNTRAQVDATALPIGLKTPLQFSRDNSGLFQMHHTLLHQIKDNLRNLVLTNHGERLGFYDFGADLKNLTFELGAEDADAEAIRRIGVAVAKYMPFIDLKTFEPSSVSNPDTPGMARVNIKITYDVPRIGASNQGLDVVLYYGG